jgi:two-component system response regulator (stage 0 sporulation protein F)
MPVKLLIVDDEPKIRSMLTGCLEQDGRTITTAASGEEAMKLIAQDPPQLMIVDMKMPGLSGLEVLREIRTHTPPIGVFLLTGFDDETIEQQAHALGALGVIHKPLMFAEIRQLISDAIAKLPPS